MVPPISRATAFKIFGNYKENLKNADEGNLNIYYLFVININTKYLYVFPYLSKIIHKSNLHAGTTMRPSWMAKKPT
jgi:hypothetical protein